MFESRRPSRPSRSRRPRGRSRRGRCEPTGWRSAAGYSGVAFLVFVAGRRDDQDSAVRPRDRTLLDCEVAEPPIQRLTILAPCLTAYEDRRRLVHVRDVAVGVDRLDDQELRVAAEARDACAVSTEPAASEATNVPCPSRSRTRRRAAESTSRCCGVLSARSGAFTSAPLSITAIPHARRRAQHPVRHLADARVPPTATPRRSRADTSPPGPARRRPGPA